MADAALELFFSYVNDEDCRKQLYDEHAGWRTVFDFVDSKASSQYYLCDDASMRGLADDTEIVVFEWFKPMPYGGFCKTAATVQADLLFADKKELVLTAYDCEQQGLRCVDKKGRRFDLPCEQVVVFAKSDGLLRRTFIDELLLRLSAFDL
jgi:hypothetical protein